MFTEPTLMEKFYIPTDLVPFNALQDFQATIPDPLEDEDQNLSFFQHNYEENYTVFPRGNLPLIRKHFGHLDIVDLRVAKPMKIDLKFKAELRPGQQKVADKILSQDEGFGIIQAPPRFGKTVVMTYLTCKLGLKTIFLSHQVDLSEQALNTFYDMTNIKELEEIHNQDNKSKKKKKLIGIVKKWKDLEDFDVAFLPYQKFVHEVGLEKLQEFRNTFGLVFVDESHKSNADTYSKVVTTFNARYRMGVTATPETKSRTHVISEFILGPVVVKGKADQVPCQVTVVKTGVFIPYRVGTTKASSRKFFNDMYGFLAIHRFRNEYLVNWIESYANAGHCCVAVCERNNMLDLLTKMLKDRGIAAEAFHGQTAKGKNREAILNRARSGETQVLLARRNMVLGLDIPRLTVFFNLTASANPPNYYQELSRVRTPFEGKFMAYIIDFVDSHPVCHGCYKSREKVYRQESFEIVTL